MEELLPKLPIANWIDLLIEWLVDQFEPFFEGVASGLEYFVDRIVLGLGFIPVIILAILVGLLAWKVCNWRIALFTVYRFITD